MPRERVLADRRQVSVGELLAVLLRTGSQDGDALASANALLDKYGGLQALLRARVEHLLTEKGLGPAKVATLVAAGEIALRLDHAILVGESSYGPPAKGPPAKQVMHSASVVKRYLQRRIGGYERETFVCLLLDTRHRLIEFFEAFLGSIDRAHVYPREVLKRALAVNAAAVVFAHNHPSGIAEPSHADIELTRQLTTLLKLVDIRVIDHVIVAEQAVTSMAERGLM